ARAAEQVVDAGAAGHDVVPRPALDAVVARAAEQGVVAAAADDRVVVGAARLVVVAVRADDRAPLDVRRAGGDGLGWIRLGRRVAVRVRGDDDDAEREPDVRGRREVRELLRVRNRVTRLAGRVAPLPRQVLLDRRVAVELADVRGQLPADADRAAHERR